MTRRLFMLASLGSALLLAVTIAVWVHSRRQWDVVCRDDQRQLSASTLWLLAASRGSIWVYRERYDATLRQNRGPQLYEGVASQDHEPSVLVSDPTWGTGGDDEFRHRWPDWVRHGTSSDGWQMLIVPLWCLATAAAILPALRVGFWLRAARRIKAGHCRACGYDLRASSGRCPECGTTITSQEEAKA